LCSLVADIGIVPSASASAAVLGWIQALREHTAHHQTGSQVPHSKGEILGVNNRHVKMSSYISLISAACSSSGNMTYMKEVCCTQASICYYSSKAAFNASTLWCA
jgi:hypothetical protein